MLPDLAGTFARYEDFDPSVPVWCVTPEVDACIHRFFDTSPFSPSGRYLALTQLGHEDRLPSPGDAAHIVLVDLLTGRQEIVAETRGWDTQLGAQAQWGAEDTQLFFNDMDMVSWRPHGVRMDPLSGVARRLQGTVYMVSPDGRWAASPCLLRTGLTQAGYGVIAPPDCVPTNTGAAADDGLYVTDTESGKVRLLVSFADIIDAVRPAFDDVRYGGGDFYGFHVKWNLQATRLMLVLRWRPRAGGKMTATVITMDVDGTNVRAAIPDTVWSKGGHHPNWTPDGDWVMMNLKLDGQTMRLVKARYDGTQLLPMSASVMGSGHPSLHPDGRHVVTDTYLQEPLAFGDGTTPLRWIDIERGRDQVLARIQTKPDFYGPKGELRVDPHPAWDRGFTHIAFNACIDGRRRVFVADLSQLLG